MLICVPIIIMLFGTSALAQDVQNFTISNFEVDYYLSQNSDKSSSLKVDEKIVAEFPSFDQNHGILRAIPQRYQDHTLSLKIDSVKKADGSSWNYSTYHENDNLVLKIGDANKFVHGSQTYLISYTMRNVINFQSSGDEFYWDVNGDQWPQTFDQVVARIHIPSQLQTSLQDRQVCYSGYFGEVNQTCEISRSKLPTETLITAITTQSLAAYQTLTFVIGFNSNTFSLGPEVAHEQFVKKIKNVASGIFVVTPLFVAFGIMLNRWRKFGDDPKGRGVIIAEYQPPKGLDVLSSDYIFKGELRPQAISAALIELATKKLITIYEIPKHGWFGKKDYELELKSLKNPPAWLSGEAREVLSAVFENLASPKRVKISNFKSSSTKNYLYESLNKTKEHLAENLYSEGYYIKNPSKIRSSYMTWSVLPFLAGIGLLFVSRGQFYPLTFLAVGLLIAALVMFLFAFIMPARTQRGVVVHDYMLGLKSYIKLAEADRLKYLQSTEGAEKIIDKTNFNPKSPTAKIKLFESLLPYAILFGLEKSWAKQFEGIYAKPPDWYQGNPSAFQTGIIVGSVGDFNASANSSFAAPSSSGGSGFSGGAGGGGGGGGGGGW